MFNKNKLEKELSDLNLNGKSAFTSTNLIKVYFAKLFKDAERYCIYANQIGQENLSFVDENIEYLYDLIVLEFENNNPMQNLLGTKLVLESEWGKEKEIIDDFNKLLIANSEYKALVFQSSSFQDYTTFISQLKSRIDAYSPKIGKYFLCCFVNHKSLFEVHEA